MPDKSRTLSPAQVWAVVANLESLGGTVTVTPEDVQVVTTDPSQAAGGAPTPPANASLEPADILATGACMTCHKLGEQGGAIGPELTAVGGRLSADQIRTAILDPNAETSPGFEAFAGTMPVTFGQQFSAAQMEALVGYLAEQR